MAVASGANLLQYEERVAGMFGAQPGARLGELTTSELLHIVRELHRTSLRLRCSACALAK